MPWNVVLACQRTKQFSHLAVKDCPFLLKAKAFMYSQEHSILRGNNTVISKDSLSNASSAPGCTLPYGK